MSERMHYKIIFVGHNEGGHEALQLRVNNAIKAGFVPVGGLCVDGWGNGSNFFQAMICEWPEEGEEGGTAK